MTTRPTDLLRCGSTERVVLSSHVVAVANLPLSLTAMTIICQKPFTVPHMDGGLPKRCAKSTVMLWSSPAVKPNRILNSKLGFLMFRAASGFGSNLRTGKISDVE